MAREPLTELLPGYVLGEARRVNSLSTTRRVLGCTRTEFRRYPKTGSPSGATTNQTSPMP